MLRALLFVAALLIAPLSFAQFSGEYNGIPTQVVGPYSEFPRVYDPAQVPAGSTIANSGVTGGGVKTTVSGNATATLPTGTKVNIPVQATATITKAAMARAARKAVGLIPYIGNAYLAYEIYKELTATGAIQQDTSCGAVACKPAAPSPDTTKTPYSGYCYQGMNQCLPTWDQYCAVVTAPSGYTSIQPRPDTGRMTCYRGTSMINTIPLPVGTCPSGSLVDGTMVNSPAGTTGGCYVAKQNPSTQYTDAELEQTFSDYMQANPDFARRYYEATWRDIAAGRLSLSEADLIPRDTPVSISASPVTGPQETTGTRTINNPDGTTSTETTKKQSTVTPKPSGSTVQDAKVDYETKTVTTVTNINNTTNVTNTTTSENTETAKDDCAANPSRVGCSNLGTPPAPQDIPNKEVAATYTPVPFASNATCPQPITFDLGPFGGPKAISYQPFCDTMANVRPLFLACAAAACAWIFAAGITKL